MSEVIMKIEGLVNGDTTPFDGQFLVEYAPDPGDPPLVVNGRPLACHLVTTPDPAAAKRMTFTEAHALWSARSKTQPVRPWDGQPNRPLTAFTIQILREDAT